MIEADRLPIMAGMDEKPGSRIKRAREARGWDIKQLADAVGVSYQAVWQWENDPAENTKTRRTSPGNVKRYQDIGAALDVPWKWLMEGEGDDPTRNSMDGERMSSTDADGTDGGEPPLDRKDLRELLEPLVQILYDTGFRPTPATFVDVLYAAYDGHVVAKAKGHAYDLADLTNVISIALRDRR